jgi:hypothetical protein
MDLPRGKDECIDFGIEADTGSSSGQVQVSATGVTTLVVEKKVGTC